MVFSRTFKPPYDVDSITVRKRHPWVSLAPSPEELDDIAKVKAALTPSQLVVYEGIFDQVSADLKVILDKRFFGTSSPSPANLHEFALQTTRETNPGV